MDEEEKKSSNSDELGGLETPPSPGLSKQDSEYVRGVNQFIQKYGKFREECRIDEQPYVAALPPENHYGSTEYKLKLLNPTHD